MIVGIGTDIVEISRVVEASEKNRFIEKFFTYNERKIFDKKRNSIAGNFAVKEAVAKMFGTGIRGFELRDVEVLRDELGKPYVVLHNKANAIATEMNINRIHVSISDTDKYAVAYVIGEE